jgi:hypothetical protein
MARVCEDWFPKGSRKYQKEDGFYMDDTLKAQIDILAKNIKNDWDFTIVITGQGEVRVGKSVLELQIMCYWSWLMENLHGVKVPFSVKENVVLNWERLIEQGNALAQKAHYCALGYDEAGETMEGIKSATKELKAVRDYLRECGQYNFLNILVLPEFFTLPKGIALTRSIFLLDVYYIANEEGIFERGYFKFYSKRNKKMLYLKGKKELDYNAHPYNFQGKFNNFYPIDEQEYRDLKLEALRNRSSNVRDIVMETRNCLFFLLNKKLGYTQEHISEQIWKYARIKVPQTTIKEAINVFMQEDFNE